MSDVAVLTARLDAIESLLRSLVERQKVKDWYTVAEFAQLADLTPYTVRMYCRKERLAAVRKSTGRGDWALSHEEYLRHQREGLLPHPIHLPRENSQA